MSFDLARIPGVLRSICQAALAATNGQAVVWSSATGGFVCSAPAPATHVHAGADVTSGTVDGDRLPAVSTTKKGAVPATTLATDRVLMDDGSFRHIHGMRYHAWHRPISTSAYESNHGSLGTGSGTVTYDLTSTTGFWAIYTTVDGDGNAAGRVGGNADKTLWNHGPIYWQRFSTGSNIGTVTYWLGMFSTAVPTKAAAYTRDHAMLRWVAGTDVNWKFSTGDSANQGTSDLGVAPVLSTEYWLKIDNSVAAQCTLTLYTVTGTGPALTLTQIATATRTTNLPTGGTQCNWAYYIFNIGAGFTRFFAGSNGEIESY
jgi:hypothetical protein